MRRRAAAVVVFACLAVGLVLVASATGAASRAKPGTAVGETAPVPASSDLGGFDNNDAVGQIVNFTPYTWTLVATGATDSPASFWDASSLPKTVKPGQSFTYRIRPQANYATTRKYNGWFSYRADTINHSEYLTLDLEGAHCWGLCLPRDGPPLVPTMYNATQAPQDKGNYGWNFGPATPNPEIGWTASGYTNVWPIYPDSAFDFTLQTKGTYTLDAAKTPPQLAALINAMCAGAKDTSCSFTPIGDIHWGIGDLQKQTSVKSCGAEPPDAVTRSVKAKKAPAESPDWHSVSVEVGRTRSVSVGGSLSAAAEVKLFGIINSEVSAKIGIEHEWSETRTFEKATKVFVPQDWIAAVWVAPVVGKVTGTLVVKTSLASYTITNFVQSATGVSKNLMTPAFNIMTSAQPMTVAQYRALCPSTSIPPGGGRG